MRIDITAKDLAEIGKIVASLTNPQNRVFELTSRQNNLEARLNDLEATVRQPKFDKV